MVKKIGSLSKSVDVSLSVEDVKNAVLAYAGAKKASKSTVSVNADGTALVTFTITKEATKAAEPEAKSANPVPGTGRP
jgi:hypothetical protein